MFIGKLLDYERKWHLLVWALHYHLKCSSWRTFSSLKCNKLGHGLVIIHLQLRTVGCSKILIVPTRSHFLSIDRDFF